MGGRILRIEKIKLVNYRQFKYAEFIFNKGKSHDLNIIIGKNGIGKTNLLNAINWCLYGDQPYFSKKSQQLPLLNLKSIEESNIGDDVSVITEIYTNTDNNSYIKFVRTENFRINVENNIKKPISQGTEFEVHVIDEKNNTKILKHDDAKSLVERFIPFRLREFFFFDGERLDDYFKEATGENIKRAIFDISQLDILDRMERNLSQIIDEYDNKLSKANPKIEKARDIWKRADDNYKSAIDQFEKCKTTVASAKIKIKEYDDKLKSKPDIISLEKERSDLKDLITRKQSSRLIKIKEKENLLFTYGKILMLYPSIVKSFDIIQIKRKNKEIPVTVDTNLLNDILKIRECKICGQPIDEKSEVHIHNLLKQIIHSSEISQTLTDIEIPLAKMIDEPNNFEKDMKAITRDIGEYDDELNRFNTRLNAINSQLEGSNEEEILDWTAERKKFESIYDSNQSQLGYLEGKIDDLKTVSEKFEHDYNDELKKEEKFNKIKQQREFINKALKVVKETKEDIMKQTREKIQYATKNTFFDLVWKKKTFKDVFIDENYNIKLIHSKDYECLDSVSAAERELMALSFTLALHKISGFDSPIIIDTPVARVSDENRENLGHIFSDVSDSKQIILLFTPDEYSANISNLLDKNYANKFVFKSIDESETQIEVL